MSLRSLLAVPFVRQLLGACIGAALAMLLYSAYQRVAESITASVAENATETVDGPGVRPIFSSEPPSIEIAYVPQSGIVANSSVSSSRSSVPAASHRTAPMLPQSGMPALLVFASSMMGAALMRRAR